MSGGEGCGIDFVTGFTRRHNLVPVRRDGGVAGPGDVVVAVSWPQGADGEAAARAFVERQRPGFTLGRRYVGVLRSSAVVVPRLAVQA